MFLVEAEQQQQQQHQVTYEKSQKSKTRTQTRINKTIEQNERRKKKTKIWRESIHCWETRAAHRSFGSKHSTHKNIVYQLETYTACMHAEDYYTKICEARVRALSIKTKNIGQRETGSQLKNRLSWYWCHLMSANVTLMDQNNSIFIALFNFSTLHFKC